MELKYDIYMLNNAQGTGEKRQYVRIVQHEPMTEKQLQEKIQNRCSLTKGDVAAVLAELHDLMVEEFSMGRRFYIPEIGYFSMSASLEMPEENPDKKITGKEVRITGINFRPEGKLMEEVQRNVYFVRSRYSNQSTKYSEEKLFRRWTYYCKGIGLAHYKIVTRKNHHKGKEYTTNAKVWEADVTAHQFRHEFASILYEANVGELEAQKLLGHSDITTTRRIYTHIRERQLENAAAQIENYIQTTSK